MTEPSLIEQMAKRMEELGLSQQALADRIGTSQANVFRVLSGTVKHSRYLEPILRELGLNDAPRRAGDPNDPVLRIARALELLTLYASRISAVLENEALSRGTPHAPRAGNRGSNATRERDE